MVLTATVVDAFAALGLTPDAPEDVARSTYKKLALAHHPDRNHGDHSATQRFQQIGAAWAVCQRHYEHPANSYFVDPATGRPPREPYDGRRYDRDEDVPLDDDEAELFFRFMFEEMLFNRFTHAQGQRYRRQRAGAAGGGMHAFSGGFAASQKRQDENAARQREQNEAYQQRVEELEKEIAAENAEKERLAREEAKQRDRLGSAQRLAFSCGRNGDGAGMRAAIEGSSLDVTAPERLATTPKSNKAKNQESQTKKTHETMLHVAASFCDVPTVQFLLSRGASISALNPARLTPFHAAVKCGNGPVVAWFIAQRKGGSKAAADGRTPLQLALETKCVDVEVVKMVVREATVHDVERAWGREDLNEEVREVLLTKKGFKPDGGKEEREREERLKREAEEAKKQAAAAARKQAEAATRKREEERVRKLTEERVARAAAEQARKAAEDARKHAEDARRKQAAEEQAARIRAEEARRSAAEGQARRAAEELAVKQAEESRQRLEAERRRAKEHEQRHAAERARLAAEREARLRIEREAEVRQEAAERRQAEEAARRLRERDERLRFEMEERLRAEEAIRKEREREQIEHTRHQAREEAKMRRRAEQSARDKARNQRVREERMHERELAAHNEEKNAIEREEREQGAERTRHIDAREEAKMRRRAEQSARDKARHQREREDRARERERAQFQAPNVAPSRATPTLPDVPTPGISSFAPAPPSPPMTPGRESVHTRAIPDELFPYEPPVRGRDLQRERGRGWGRFGERRKALLEEVRRKEQELRELRTQLEEYGD